MKYLISILCLVSASAFAAPFVVSDPVDTSVTHCGVFMDATPKATVPVALEGTQKICKFDLAGISTGAHSVKMTVLYNDPVWGSQESAQSAPLAFTKPGTLPVPNGLRLSP